AHCPLYGTVLDRDPARDLDYDSLESFFYLENSEEVRAVLAKHPNACLYISGHTHAGWGSPNLVLTEDLGGHPFTYVNLSSPWYTGKHHGIQWILGREKCRFLPDDPDLSVSLAVRVSREQISLRFREHRTGTWLTEWVVPVK